MLDQELQEGSERPLACSLPAASLVDRVAAWRSVAGRALRRREGEGWVETTYPADALPALQDLIRAEAACCPFLEFAVRERGEMIEVRLAFPPGFAPMIEAITSGGSSSRSR